MESSCRIKWNWSDRIDPITFQKFCNYLINYHFAKRVSPYDREGLDCGIDGIMEKVSFKLNAIKLFRV